jgi:filamentous hemagglutinin family protein
MNHIYRLIVSRVTGLLVVVAETTRGHTKNKTIVKSGGTPLRRIYGSMTALCTALMIAFSPMALALPQEGNVVSGSGTIAQSGDVMTINQATNRLGINWQSFSIGAGQWVQFNQPSASSVVLNRVLGSNPSEIFGRLTANGQVFITNPNGILFGRTAQVNVGGLVATTNQLSDTDWNESRYTFSKAGSAGSVVNQGELNAADAGYIALLAPEVRNEGVIRANLGSAILAAGDKVTLQLNANSLLGFQIDQGALNALVENKNLVVADGGQVFLSARASGDVASAVVNQSGTIRAQTIENKSGTILLMADMTPTESGHWQNHGRGTLNFSGGLLDASAPNGGDGGFVETSGAEVRIGDLARVRTLAASGKTGTWLIDPIDFTISAGEGSQTSSGIGAATLSSNLGEGNVEITTDASMGGNGDIFVNAEVTWSANKLTLSAHRHININENLNAGEGTAQLALHYGQGSVGGIISGVEAAINFAAGKKVYLPAGDNFFTKQGSGGSEKTYTVLISLGSAGSTTETDLQGMQGNLAKNYALGADIDASATAGWGEGGAAFSPIGFGGGDFSALFHGLGHTISGLYVNRSGSDNVGLFGSTASTSRISDVHLVAATIFGQNNVGGLVGDNSGTINASTITTSTVSGIFGVGGLVGVNTGTILGSSASVTVSGSNTLGGLVGLNEGVINTSTSTSTVLGGDYLGGLVGFNSSSSGTITGSSSSSSVSGLNYLGGLVGDNLGLINTSTSTSTVLGGDYLGGLVGFNRSSGTITGSSSSSSVSGLNYLGGLVGMSAGSINTSTSTSTVLGNDSLGGLVGANSGSISGSSAMSSVSGNDMLGGLVGLNDAGALIVGSTGSSIVSGHDDVGGLVGSNLGSISASGAASTIY